MQAFRQITQARQFLAQPVVQFLPDALLFVDTNLEDFAFQPRPLNDFVP